MPCLLAIALERVFVEMLPARLPLFARPIFVEPFRYDHGDLLSTTAIDGDLGEACQVLPHVGHKHRGVDVSFCST